MESKHKHHHQHPLPQLMTSPSQSLCTTLPQPLPLINPNLQLHLLLIYLLQMTFFSMAACFLSTFSLTSLFLLALPPPPWTASPSLFGTAEASPAAIRATSPWKTSTKTATVVIVAVIAAKKAGAMVGQEREEASPSHPSQSLDLQEGERSVRLQGRKMIRRNTRGR